MVYFNFIWLLYKVDVLSTKMATKTLKVNFFFLFIDVLHNSKIQYRKVLIPLYPKELTRHSMYIIHSLQFFRLHTRYLFDRRMSLTFFGTG